MATADQVKALIKSHSEGDDSRFYSIAIQVAAHAARQGHTHLANQLRNLIDEAKEKGYALTQSNKVISINQPRGELTGLLSVAYPKEQLSSLILTENTTLRLNRVVLEQRQKSLLLQHGLNPRRKILLFGAPGTGKTFTASALAGELHLPLYTILLDGLITKYMGETAAKLRLIFDSIDRVRGVYFFDEIDAIGANRASQNDVGEIRRVLNSFLQFLEQSNSESLILAATNNLDLLDKALFRRFDDVIEYQIPDFALIIQTFKNRLAIAPKKSIDFDVLAQASQGLSFAEICKASDDALKTLVLNEKDQHLSTDMVVQSIQERLSARK
jgi:SpoVK/Ycf46/Vps4 family AAA+-type ATPase